MEAVPLLPCTSPIEVKFPVIASPVLAVVAAAAHFTHGAVVADVVSTLVVAIIHLIAAAVIVDALVPFAAAVSVVAFVTLIAVAHLAVVWLVTSPEIFLADVAWSSSSGHPTKKEGLQPLIPSS